MKSDEQHFEGKIAMKVMIMSPKGRVLVCRNHHDKDTWDLPGGTLNEGEDPKVGLLRETYEELGIELAEADLVSADIFIKPKTGKQIVVLIYKSSLPEEIQNFSFDETEISEAKWIAKENLLETKLFPEYEKALKNLWS